MHHAAFARNKRLAVLELNTGIRVVQAGMQRAANNAVFAFGSLGASKWKTKSRNAAARVKKRNEEREVHLQKCASPPVAYVHSLVCEVPDTNSES